ASEVDHFNDAIVEAIVEIGVWIAFSLATSWIPGVDVATAAGAVLRGATLMERIVGLLQLLRALLLSMRWSGRIGRAWILNLTLLYGARFAVRAHLGADHDPTKGWTAQDGGQLLVDSVIGAVTSAGVSLVPFVRVTGLGRFAVVRSNRAVFEYLVESPVIGAVSSGSFAMVNQGLFL